MEDTSRANGYRSAAWELLGKADEAFRSGDMVQASEKGWGAVAQILKAIAQERGWRQGSHRNLSEVVTRLASEAGEQRITELFNVANGLHMNFYENWLTNEAVEVGLGGVRELLDRLQKASPQPRA